MQKERPIVLSIAGFDPSAGAGVLADIKTLECLRVQGLAVITADTLQTEEVCYEVAWRSTAEIVKGVDLLMGRYSVDAVKIGIVPDADTLQAILHGIRQRNQKISVVWDPVIESSSGTSFFNEQDLPRLAELTGYMDLLTPNYLEYALLKPYIHADRRMSILIKGGHNKGEIGVDVLIQGDRETRLYPSAGIKDVYPKHGSGCVLSSAIAAYLAQGEPMEAACRLGKKYVEQFLKSSPTLIGYHHDGK